LAGYLTILGELFGIFQPSERFGLNSLPNKSPNFAKQCTKSQPANMCCNQIATSGGYINDHDIGEG
jgi:hypothetical protein